MRLPRRSIIALALVLWPTLASPGLARQVSRVLLEPSHAAWTAQAPERFRARFATTQGDFVLEVNRSWAPHAADRLYNLVRLGFYDDTRVYRVRAGFIAQFGLSGDPAVNEVWYERTMLDDAVRRSNRRGMVAFASLPEPHTRTTQVFINLADNERLDEQGFAPFGRVVAGMEVVDALYAEYDEGAGGGMRGGQQGRIVREGNAHLDAEFPRLDRILAATIEPGLIQRYPNPGSNRIRVEGHLLPAVTTGPLDPTWSPEGSEIAFSMRGDIWKVPADGGVATRLTSGPAYHFEPDWSPDGRSIAFSRDLDGNLDIGLVPAAGGREVMLTSHPQNDIQPAWSADSSTVYFSSSRSSARQNGFDLYRVSTDSPGAVEAVVQTRGHQIYPTVSPDGSTLAFVSPLPGRLGAGALVRHALDGATEAEADPRPAVVHWEETSYRVEPSWSADGRSLLFVSDAAGSDDLALVPVTGGTPARLTEDDGDEYSPAMSPDGTRIAFVSNRYGPMRLYTAPAGGGRRAGWSRVPVELPVEELGTLHLRVLDQQGAPVPARVGVEAADGRAYAPADGFHRVASASGQHYFHSDGDDEVLVPPGRFRVLVQRGFERRPAVIEGEVRAGGRAQVGATLEPIYDAARFGWYSGETHAHDLHQGRYGLDHEAFFRQLVAEDLRVTNSLIHMDGTRIMGRWADLTGEPHPLSTGEHILQYAQEFRGSFGHVGLLGVSEFITPLIGGTSGTAFAADVLNYEYIDAAERQGGVGGFMHPYTRAIEQPSDGSNSEIALDVALGKGSFFDVACIWYDELANAEMYYRYLNAGFRLAATGGSDNFADVWRDPPPGTARTYARIDGPLSVPAWLEAVRAGRTFATTGPLLFLRVDGVEPGAEVSPADGAVAVQLDLVSATPVDRVELLVNGEVVWSEDVRGLPAADGREPRAGWSQRVLLERSIEVPPSGWIAARALGPPSSLVGDSYAFAQTSPVWLVGPEGPFVDPEAARFLAEMVRALWSIVESRGRFASDEARELYGRAAMDAIEIYETRAAQAESRMEESR